MLTIEKIIRVRSTNPNTQEEVLSWRAVLSDLRELRILNTTEELQALGSMEAVKSSLTMRQGTYGPYMQLRRSEVLEESLF